MICFTKNVRPAIDSRFMIFGERNSGTNYVQQMIQDNFGLDAANIIIWKHWVGYLNVPNAKDGTENTLSVGVVRDPIDWLSSMKKYAPHANHLSKKNWIEFLTNEWYSLDDTDHKEIMIDRNYHTGQRYKNILELRSNKLRWMLDPDIPGPYILIRYEDMLSNPDEVLSKIAKEFNVNRKTLNLVEKDVKHGGNYIKRNYRRPPEELINTIRDNLDLKLEEKLGYKIE